MDFVCEIGLTCFLILALSVIACCFTSEYRRNVFSHTCLAFLALVFFIIGTTDVIHVLEQTELAIICQHIVKSIIWFMGSLIFSIFSIVFDERW